MLCERQQIKIIIDKIATFLHNSNNQFQRKQREKFLLCVLPRLMWGWKTVGAHNSHNQFKTKQGHRIKTKLPTLCAPDVFLLTNRRNTQLIVHCRSCVPGTVMKFMGTRLKAHSTEHSKINPIKQTWLIKTISNPSPQV